MRNEPFSHATEFIAARSKLCSNAPVEGYARDARIHTSLVCWAAMADEGGRVYSDKKVAYAERLENLLATLPSVLLISADNVGSQQMHIVRAELRKEGQKAEVLMGKNTMIKFVIRRAAAQKVHCMLPTIRQIGRASNSW